MLNQFAVEESAVWAEGTGFSGARRWHDEFVLKSVHQALPDHPLLDFTSNGSQAVALAALISEEGRQLVLQRADARTVAVCNSA